MEGLVTAYSGTSLTVNVDTTGGSGTAADWNINLAGNIGASGATGATGATGPQGAQGATGPQGAQGATGPSGAAGAGYAASSTSSLAIAGGSTGFTTQSGLAYSVGARVRASSNASSANYMEGLVTAYSGTSLTVNVDTTGGSGTAADWNINLAGNIGASGATGATGATGPQGPQGATGPQGAQGATGPSGAAGAGYAASSTSSLAIAGGSTSFTTQSGLAYSVGARVRASSNASSANYMEGLVTAYSGTSLTVNVDTTGGSGTAADWNINLAGNIGTSGATGATGATGPQGPQGATGPQGAQGATGPQGAQGATGPQGLQGVLGAGVNAQTVSYAVDAGDNGKLITMNGPSLTLTLPAAAPSSTWYIAVENTNPTVLTVARNGLKINGGTSDLSLGQSQVIQIWTDGSNYFTGPPLVAGANITLTPSSTGLTIGTAGLGSGSVTNVATTAPITGGPITTTGTIACATCVTSAASLSSNAVVIGGGGQASSTIAADAISTHALFATAGAPAFRALASGDLPAGLVNAAITINDTAGTNTTNIGTGTTTGAVTIGGTGTQAIALGNGAGVKTVNVGSNSTTSTTTILAGTGNLALNASAGTSQTNIGTGTTTGAVTIGGTGTQAIALGNGAGVKTVNVGSNNTTSTTTILAGTGNLALNASAGTSQTNISTGTTTGAVTIGGTGTQAIALGNGAGVKTVNVGSNSTTSTTTILAGTGNLALNASAGTSQTNIGTGTTTGAVTIGGTGTQTIALGNGAGAKTVNVGSNNTTSTTTILSGSGGINLNVSNNQPTNVGTGSSTGAVAIGGGSNTVAINSINWNVSAAGNLTSTLATGTAPFSITSTTPVANLTAVPTTYNAAGTQQNNAHIVTGTVTFSNASSIGVTFTAPAAFTSNASFVCTVTSTVATPGSNDIFSVTYTSGTNITITATGTLSEIVGYICIGN